MHLCVLGAAFTRISEGALLEPEFVAVLLPTLSLSPLLSLLRLLLLLSLRLRAADG